MPSLLIDANEFTWQTALGDKPACHFLYATNIHSGASQ